MSRGAETKSPDFHRLFAFLVDTPPWCYSAASPSCDRSADMFSHLIKALLSRNRAALFCSYKSFINGFSFKTQQLFSSEVCPFQSHFYVFFFLCLQINFKGVCNVYHPFHPGLKKNIFLLAEKHLEVNHHI